MATDQFLITNALTKWIDNHPDEEKSKVYLTTSIGTYTLNQIKSEIENNTEFGLKMLNNIVSLTIDLLTRGKKTI